MVSTYTLANLLSLVGAGPVDRSDRTELRRITLRPGQKRLLFLCQSAEPYSDPQGHVVSLLYPQTGPYENLIKHRDLTPMNRPCRISCSCPAWNYWGSGYRSTQEGYRLLGQEHAENRPPNVRDPGGENWICKHAVRVARELEQMTFAQLLGEVGPKTAMHAQADLDAIEGAVEDYCTRNAEFLRDRLPWLAVDTAEETLTEFGMLCSDQDDPMDSIPW